MNLTQYIVELEFEQQNHDQIEELWSNLMNSNIDCVMDLEPLRKRPRTQYGRFSIFFKTKEERDLVKSILKLTE